MPRVKKPVRTLAAMERALRDPDDLSPTQVAHILTCGYQHARNLMLKGVLGPNTYDAVSRRLTVRRAGVHAYQRGGPKSGGRVTP